MFRKHCSRAPGIGKVGCETHRDAFALSRTSSELFLPDNAFKDVLGKQCGRDVVHVDLFAETKSKAAASLTILKTRTTTHHSRGMHKPPSV